MIIPCFATNRLQACWTIMNRMLITECPRDAMQGLPYFIPSEDKISYLKSLLAVGFHRLDCGSFVSEKYIPQMRDTSHVLNSLTQVKLDNRFSVIVGNIKGAKEALSHPAVDIIGFPWSISARFLHQNLNTDTSTSWSTLLEMQRLASEHDKGLSVYVSMAFGNPYGDTWSRDILLKAVDKLSVLGLNSIILSDTIGRSNYDDIQFIFSNIRHITSTKIGAHFHANSAHIKDRVSAAWDGGCRQFDSALNGLGGCPLSGHDMVGNINTLSLVQFCEEAGIVHGLNIERLMESQALAKQIFQQRT